MDEPKSAPPELIAHRGYPGRYPENTLAGITAALVAGARHVEFDVQLSGDGVPVLFHDPELARTAGAEGAVTDTPLQRLRELDVGEQARFGDRFRGTGIPTLAEAANLLEGWPAVNVFVDIKTRSVARFGPGLVMDRVWDALGHLQPRCVITCADAETLDETRRRGGRLGAQEGERVRAATGT